MNLLEEKSLYYPIEKLCQVIDCEHKTAPYVESSNYLVVRTSNVRNGNLVLNDIKHTTKEGFLEWTQRAVPRYGDVLFTREAPAGESCLVPSQLNLCIGQRMVLLRPNQELISSEFLSIYLISEKCKREIYKYSIGSTVARINIEDILKIRIVCPSLKEQEKIASFLGAVDARLTQLRRKRELLQTYKRGIMQKIFSQEIRFRGAIGLDFPNWEEKKLKSIAIINPSPKNFPDQFLYIDLESVNNGILGEPEFLDKENAPSRAQRVLKKGDILYQTVRPYQRNNLCFSLDGDYVASTGYTQLRARESPQFLYQLIHSDNFVDKVVSLCTGTSYPAINSSDLADISIFLPDSIEEQEKIANFLTAIDRKIEAVSRQLDRSERFKQGLLQKMFI
ncbi:MAG: restriction endonuclease subunit S [Phormidesmis sp. CAN_BIN44]|nr:restriction endonuclease subunit S [Phormidesmis sp. CAN_BIN44]